MKSRSIAFSIFISIVTLGVYLLIWFYYVSKEVLDEMEIDEEKDNALINLVFLIITLGIYWVWWNYKISIYLNKIERRNDMESDFWATPLSLWFGMIVHQFRINAIVESQ